MLSALRLLQYLHRLRNGGVPLVRADLPADLSLLQPIVGVVILHAGRTAIRLALRFLVVRSYLPADPFRLTGCNITAVFCAAIFNNKHSAEAAGIGHLR